MWGDETGLNVLLRRGGTEELLTIVGFDPRATGTEFSGTLDAAEVTGRLELVTAADQQGSPSEVTLSSVLKIEIVDSNGISSFQLEWSSPLGEGLGGINLEEYQGGIQPATATATPLESGLVTFNSSTGIQGLEVMHLEVMLASVVGKVECKCTNTDPINLCPDDDCDVGKECNNNTGNCKRVFIQL